MPERRLCRQAPGSITIRKQSMIWSTWSLPEFSTISGLNILLQSDGVVTMREFIEKMREQGLVIDVEEPVSADMQAPKMAGSTDKLLFFHNIEGTRAVMNLTASRRALSLALGIDEQKMVKTLADAKFDGKVRTSGTLSMKKPSLSSIPIMHHFPRDAGKYLTSGIVFSRFEGCLLYTSPS